MMLIVLFLSVPSDDVERFSVFPVMMLIFSQCSL